MVKLKSCGLRNPDTHLIPGVFHWVMFVCTMYTPMKCMNMQIEMFMDAGKYIHTCIPELFKIFCENFNIVHCGINNGIQ